MTEHDISFDEMAERSGLRQWLESEGASATALNDPVTLPIPQVGTYIAKWEGDIEDIAEQRITWQDNKITIVNASSAWPSTTVLRSDADGLHFVSREGMGEAGSHVVLRPGSRTLFRPSPLRTEPWWVATHATAKRGEKQAELDMASRYRVTKLATVQHPSGPEDVVTIAASEFIVRPDRKLVPVLGTVTVLSCATGRTMLTRVRQAGPLAKPSPSN